MDAAFWQAIVDADYAVPEGYSARELMPELVSYLGSTDPQLRDHFAYGIMVRWIVRQDYTPDDLRPLVEQMIPNLARGVGEQGTDSVFLRSFSALMLAASVYYDNHRQPYLTPDEFRRVFDAVLAYLRDEQDVRGFVAGQGWAHSVAHTADLVDELALSRHADAHDLEQILDAIAAKVMTTASPLLFNEDDRLTVAVLSALKRELMPRAAVERWLNTLADLPAALGHGEQFSDPARHSRYLNTKNLLRSLLVRLLDDDLPDTLRALVPDVRAALQRF